MARDPKGEERRSLLVNALRITAALALITYVAVNWLPAHPADRITATARVADQDTLDPATTGSITPSFSRIRIDPCVMPPGL